MQSLDFAAPMIAKGNRVADGERAARIRKAIGLTQAQVAAEIDRSANTVARAERGESDPALIHSHMWMRAERSLKVAYRQLDTILYGYDRSTGPEDVEEENRIRDFIARIEAALH